MQNTLWVVEGILVFLDQRTKVKFVVAASDSLDAMNKIGDLPSEYVMTYQLGKKRKVANKWILDQLKAKPIHHNIYFIEGLEGFECKEAECVNG